MFTFKKSINIRANYHYMAETARTFIDEENDLTALLSNLSALIHVYMDDISWVGFYLSKGKELVLGPFQGKPACTHIGEGKGACGTAVLERRPINVPDVHRFPGHIACDSESVSELVIPFFRKGNVYGVLDLDSPKAGRFTDLELEYLQKIANLLTDFLESK